MLCGVSMLHGMTLSAATTQCTGIRPVEKYREVSSLQTYLSICTTVVATTAAFHATSGWNSEMSCQSSKEYEWTLSGNHYNTL